MEFAITYAPQNFYCFAIDKNANEQFRQRIHLLSSCFSSNVFVTSNEYKMDSQGHNMSYSQFECMKLLAKPEYKWKYLILLQVKFLLIGNLRDLTKIINLINKN